MKETIEKAGFKVEIATLSGELISAGSVRLKPDLKISDVSVLDYEGFIIPCLAVDDRVVPPQKEIVTLIKEIKVKPIAAQLGSIKILAKAGLLKDKKYASAIEFSDPYFESSILSGTGVVKDFFAYDALMVYYYTKVINIMTRQSISFTQPNDEWLKTQVDSKEYSSKSELVNDLVRQARKQQRQIDWIGSKLKSAENSGFTNDSKEQILLKSKSLLNE